MEQMDALLQSDVLKQVITYLDLPVEWVNKAGMILLAAVCVVGFLWCFFGLKLIRVWAAFFGFVIGAGVGILVAVNYGLDTMVVTIIGGVAGVILAALFAIWFRVSTFIVVFFVGAGISYNLIMPKDLKMMLVCMGIGLVAALLTFLHAEAITIVGTGVYGAMILGRTASLVLPVKAVWVFAAVTIVLVILGMWLQFVMESGKRKRISLKKAKEIKEQHSTENDVEKARAMMENLDDLLDDDEEDEEDEDDDEEDEDDDEDDEEAFED